MAGKINIITDNYYFFLGLGLIFMPKTESLI